MESANPPTIKMNRWFLLWWVLANMVGLPTMTGPLIAGLYIAVAAAIWGDQSLDITGYFTIGTIMALIGLFLGGWFGLLQWLALRKHMQIGVKWIWATAVGVAAGGFMGGLIYGWIFSGPINNILSINLLGGIGFLYAQVLVLFGMANGICVGITQWVVLRRVVQNAWLWVITLPICFTLGIFLANLIQLSFMYAVVFPGPMGTTQLLTKMQSSLFLNIALALFSLISVGLATGGLLGWLFRRNKKVML